MRTAAVTMPCLAAVLSACGSCQTGPPAELRVEGDTPYVRCLAAEPPDARAWDVGPLRFAVEERTLAIDGVEPPLRVVAFAGPGPSEEALEPALVAVREASPGLVLVLGDLGDSEAVAKRTLSALARLSVPVLAIAGGRDDAVVWAAAFESLPDDARGRVIDATPFRRVVIGADELVPVAGAPGGRYARTDTACGFGRGDVDAVAEALGPPPAGGRRWLVAWAGPAGAGLGGLEGADAGDRDLERLVERAGLRGGVVAWPRVAAGSNGAFVVIRPLVGPVVETASGRRLPPGPTVLELRPEGLAPGPPEG